jgi:hypothetical protein
LHFALQRMCLGTCAVSMIISFLLLGRGLTSAFYGWTLLYKKSIRLPCAGFPDEFAVSVTFVPAASKMKARGSMLWSLFAGSTFPVRIPKFPNAKISTVTSSNICLVELMTKVRYSNWKLKQKKFTSLNLKKKFGMWWLLKLWNLEIPDFKKTVALYFRRKIFLKTNVIITNLGDRRCP